MVIWIANWIRSLTRRSNNTCGTVATAISLQSAWLAHARDWRWSPLLQGARETARANSILAAARDCQKAGSKCGRFSIAVFSETALDADRFFRNTLERAGPRGCNRVRRDHYF